MARCKVVKFKGKPKPVRFCAKKLSPKKLRSKKSRARRNLKRFACAAKGAPAAACAALGA